MFLIFVDQKLTFDFIELKYVNWHSLQKANDWRCEEWWKERGNHFNFCFFFLFSSKKMHLTLKLISNYKTTVNESYYKNAVNIEECKQAMCHRV